MATLWRYRCTRCDVRWCRVSTRLVLGPVAWNSLRYNCFGCQTFLAVPTIVDRHSWDNWSALNREDVQLDPLLSELATRIESQLVGRRHFVPVQLNLGPIQCDTCGEMMSTAKFGEHPMKCPECLAYAGEWINEGCIECRQADLCEPLPWGGYRPDDKA